MELTKLYRGWKLVQSPFVCRQYILNEIQLIFDKNGDATVCDAANSTNGKFTIEIDESKTNTMSGIINICCSMWTLRGRCWDSDEEYKEANIVDNFIHSLIKNPIKFELSSNDSLCVHYDEQKYHFIPQ